MTAFTHHHMSAEQIEDAQGPAIMLTQQDEYSEPSTILLHPWQLRAVCEQFGIIASDSQAAKTIATLTRRLMVLNERVDHLANFLANHSDSKHADLSYEQTYARATVEIADEFCADFECVELDANTPKNGGVKEPQKREALKVAKSKPAPAQLAEQLAMGL